MKLTMEPLWKQYRRDFGSLHGFGLAALVGIGLLVLANRRKGSLPKM